MLATEIERIAESKAFRDKLGPLGVEPAVLKRAEFAAFQRAEMAKWGRAVRASGATVD